MAAAIESLPFFRARALQIGIPAEAIDTLQGANLGSYGAFAFLAPYNANSTDLGQLSQSLEDVLGAAPTNVIMPLWRRLQFDAHTHVVDVNGVMPLEAALIKNMFAPQITYTQNCFVTSQC